MSRTQPYRDGRVHVAADRCVTCVFHPGNLMHLPPGRLKEIVDGNLSGGGALPCHETTHGQAPAENVCRGFYDAHRERVPGLQVAARLGLVVFVP